MGILIHKLTLCETQGHDEQFTRGYLANTSGTNVNDFVNATRGGELLTYSAISPIAHQILAPVTAPEGPAALANGWRQPRYVFQMIISSDTTNGLGIAGGRAYEFITGYTSHIMEGLHNFLPGGNMRVNVDPNLRFYVNSITSATLEAYNDNGMVKNMLRIRNNVQFAPRQYDPTLMPGTVANHQPAVPIQAPSIGWQEQNGIPGNLTPPMQYGANSNIYSLSPLSTAVASVVASNVYPNDVIPPAGVFYNANTEAVTVSNRANLDPGSFLTRAIAAANSNEAHSARQSAYNAPTTAATLANPLLMDPTISTCGCFNQLAYGTSFQSMGSISWAEMEAKSPGLSDTTDIVKSGHDVDSRLFCLGDCGVTQGVAEPMNGMNQDTLTVIRLVSMLTDILSASGVYKASFHLSNLKLNQDGAPFVVTVLEFVHMMEFVLDAKGDFSREIIETINKIRQRIMPVVTMSNQVRFDCSVYFRMYRDTTVRIAYDNQTFRDYIVPQWADGVFSPTVTYDPLRQGSLGGAIGTLTSQLYNVS